LEGEGLRRAYRASKIIYYFMLKSIDNDSR